MQTTTRMLIIDRPAGEYVVYRDGELHQRAPIRHYRTLKHIRGFFKHLGYTVIDKKGKREKQMEHVTDKAIYESLLYIQTFGQPRDLQSKAVAALTTRGYITRRKTISPSGEAFMSKYEVAAQSVHADDQPAVAAQVDAAVAIVNNELSQQRDRLAARVIDVTTESAATREALIEIRAASFQLIESIIRERAPEVLPAIAAIQRADKILFSEKK